jgi:hypothetical protein
VIISIETKMEAKATSEGNEMEETFARQTDNSVRYLESS